MIKTTISPILSIIICWYLNTHCKSLELIELPNLIIGFLSLWVLVYCILKIITGDLGPTGDGGDSSGFSGY